MFCLFCSSISQYVEVAAGRLSSLFGFDAHPCKRLFGAVWNLRLNDPARRRIDRLPENEVQLRGMVLDVAHVVQKQLRDAGIDPGEPAMPASLLIRESFNAR